MYEGTAARRIDAYEGSYAQQSMRSSFGVIEGAGLDARVRAGVSAQFIAAFKLFLVCTVALVTLCVVRVGIYSAANGLLIENTTMRTELKDARAQRDELRIERSVLSSTSRISRIATQAYGMVLAEGSETLTVGAAAAAAQAAAEAEAQAATTSQKADLGADELQSAESVEDAQAEQDAHEMAQQAISEATIVQGDGSTAGSNAVDVDSL